MDLWGRAGMEDLGGVGGRGKQDEDVFIEYIFSINEN